jgi:hypothetical protein
VLPEPVNVAEASVSGNEYAVGAVVSKCRGSSFSSLHILSKTRPQAAQAVINNKNKRFIGV